MYLKKTPKLVWKPRTQNPNLDLPGRKQNQLYRPANRESTWSRSMDWEIVGGKCRSTTFDRSNGPFMRILFPLIFYTKKKKIKKIRNHKFTSPLRASTTSIDEIHNCFALIFPISLRMFMHEKTRERRTNYRESDERGIYLYRDTNTDTRRSAVKSLFFFFFFDSSSSPSFENRNIIYIYIYYHPIYQNI